MSRCNIFYLFVVSTALLVLSSADTTGSNITQLCSTYNSLYYSCINDCRCGMCGRKCIPSQQNGKPGVGFHCNNKNWITNTPSLICAIHDDAIAPLLFALLSIVIVTVCVIFIILLLLFVHHSCSYVIRRNNVDVLGVICSSRYTSTDSVVQVL